MANAGVVLAALSDPTRQAVLNLLRRRASTVGDLASLLPVSRPAVSQHLRVLKSAGLVEEERRGTRHYFRLNPESLDQLRGHIESMWKDALTAFSDFTRKETVTHAHRRKKDRADSVRTRGRVSG